MRLFALAFLAGDLCLQYLPQLPSHKYLLLLLLVSFICCCYMRKHFKFITMIMAFILGFIFTAWYAHHLLSWSLAKNLEGKTLKIRGHIASLPIINNWGKRFLFSVNLIQDKKMNSHPLLSLSWRINKKDNAPSLHVGEEWELFVRLKRIHGIHSEGAFDYEAWAIQRGIRASGYVIIKEKNHLITLHKFYYPILYLREYLQRQLKNVLPNTTSAPWLSALIIGEKNGALEKDWKVLRRTGTNHLMAIAGLHIGLLAGWVHAVVTFLWRRIGSLALYFPAKQAGICAALVVGIAYSAIAGFSLPTQRACLMLGILSLSLLTKRKVPSWHIWSLALLCVLIINPLSVLTESFWLSFGTIALIIYGLNGRVAPSGIWWKWGKAQWVIGIGLIPITLALFQECSFISIIANIIAIPFLGFLILPFCFLSSMFLLISKTIGGWFIVIADFNLSILWKILTGFASLPIASWQQAIPNSYVLITSLIAVILLLLPAGMPGRILCIIWFLPLLLFKPKQPEQGELWLTVLDVGQGLSVVVQTHRHLLIYDAGPKFSTQSDMGEQVVLPYLHHIGVKKIDMLIISHGDNDHIGGANALLNTFPNTTIKTSEPDKLNLYQSTYCLAGINWEWDQIHFSFLYPSINELHKTNDSSCVLRIEAGDQVILLTGDIEKYAETILLHHPASLLRSDILVAPHHGSKTSGLKSFVEAVSPKFVIYSTGYRNKYHFPHASVVAQYAYLQSLQLNTSEMGSILLKVGKNNKTIEPTIYKTSNARWWHSL